MQEEDKNKMSKVTSMTPGGAIDLDARDPNNLNEHLQVKTLLSSSLSLLSLWLQLSLLSLSLWLYLSSLCLPGDVGRCLRWARGSEERRLCLAVQPQVLPRDQVRVWLPQKILFVKATAVFASGRWLCGSEGLLESLFLSWLWHSCGAVYGFWMFMHKFVYLVTFVKMSEIIEIMKILMTIFPRSCCYLSLTTIFAPCLAFCSGRYIEIEKHRNAQTTSIESFTQRLNIL